MKRKMLTAVASMLAVCMLGVGCQIYQSFGSLVPEEYGEWDNYYIYRGNVRSKTTGEDGEYLVTAVTAGDKTYTVDYCDDSAIVEDDIYLCLRLAYSGENGLEIKNGLIKYNVKEKTQETVMLDYAYQPENDVTYIYHPYGIEQICEDEGLLLHGQCEEITLDDYGTEQTSYRNAYFKVDYNGVFLEEVDFEPYGYTRLSDDYFIKTVTSSSTGEVTISYLTWDMQEGLPVCTYDNAEVYVECAFVERNDVQGFLLKTYGLKEDTATESNYGDKLKKVEFFNVATNQLASIYEGDTYVEWVEIPENEYFITYEYETVNYTQKGGLFETPEEYTATLRKNCAVHHILYSANSVDVETEYTFEASLGLQDVKGVANNKELYIAMVWYENAAGCNNGGYQSKSYKVDLENGSLSKINDETWRNSQTVCYGSYALETGASCGNYGYYIERIKLSTVNDRTSYAYRLQRYNSADKKTDVMQLWKGTGSEEGEKYCELMWRSGGSNIDEFIVRNY